MADALDATFALTVTGSFTPDTDVGNRKYTFNSGSNNFDAMTQTFSVGDAANQAEKMFFDERTVTATTADNLDLAGSLTDPFGNTLTFAAIKAVLIAVDSPDGSKSLQVGPRAVANAWVGPFGDASDYLTVYCWLTLINPSAAGWSVTAGTGDLLCIYNPGATSVTYRVLILGEV